MIVKLPKTDYELSIYNILNSKEYANLVPGERAILYDLATQEIPKYVNVNWESLDLNDYIHNIKLSYIKHKNQIGLNVVCACINDALPNYIATLEGTGFDKKLIISDNIYFK